MKKVIGYVISLAGLVLLFITVIGSKLNIKILESISSGYLTVAGLILVVVGVVLLAGRKKSNQAQEEVPIYQGTGKNRKIVGYRRD